MPESPTSAFRPKTTILRKALRQSLLLAGLSILGLGFTAFVVSRGMLTERILAQVSAIAGSQRDAVEEALRAARTQAVLVAGQPEVKDVLSGRSPDLQSLAGRLKDDQTMLISAHVFDAAGRHIAGMGPDVPSPGVAAARTSIRPVLSRYGWHAYDVSAPVRGDQNERGTLVLRYGAEALSLTLRSSLPLLGQTGEIYLGASQSGDLVIFHPVTPTDKEQRALTLGSLESQQSYGLPLARAVLGEEGVTTAQDHRGTQTLAAYRILPTLGWGLVAQVDRAEGLSGVRWLGASFGAIGALILLLAGILAFLLARDLTVPIRTLAAAVAGLGPKKWSLQTQINTGDEVELLNRSVADMAERLRRLYEHLEEEVQARTTELRRQYAIDRGILDSIQQGIMLIDREGRITAANPAAEKLLQRTGAQMIGMEAEKALELHIHNGEIFKGPHPLTECVRNRCPFHSDPAAHVSLLRPDGTLLPALLVVTPFFQGEELLGCIAVIQDMTDERQMDYMKSDFITLASHQMRTPLSSIRWYVELFGEDKNLSDEQKSNLAEMEKSVVRMINLLNALLHASRVDGEGGEPQREMVDLCAVTEEMRESFASQSEETKTIVRTKLPREPLTVFTDPTLLRIILQNLLSNALKYSKRGSEIIVELSEQQGFAHIVVRDQGVGIPAAEQTRVFQKFFRAKNVRTLDTDGNGLGLYITKSMVQKLGGTIAFESKEGSGTMFAVRLPMQSSGH